MQSYFPYFPCGHKLWHGSRLAEGVAVKQTQMKVWRFLLVTLKFTDLFSVSRQGGKTDALPTKKSHRIPYILPLPRVRKH